MSRSVLQRKPHIALCQGSPFWKCNLPHDVEWYGSYGNTPLEAYNLWLRHFWYRLLDHELVKTDSAEFKAQLNELDFWSRVRTNPKA